MRKNYRSFRIKIDRKCREYYVAMIFDSRDEMRRFAKDTLKDKTSLRQEASTHSFVSYKMVNGKEVTSPIIGALLFYNGGFGPGTVAHEMAHAVNYLFLRNKEDFNVGSVYNENWRKNDEAYATILGYTVNQFWKQYCKKFNKPNLYERY